MVKVLIINSYIHEKNRIGFLSILNHLQIEYKVGTPADIPNYDVIYSPSQPINPANYPNKKFIFGPHFSVFPNHHQLQSLHTKNSIYIHPSEWAAQVWRNMGAEQFLPIKSFPFTVDTTKFNSNSSNERTEVFLYNKQRNPEELNFLTTFLNEQNIKYRLFDYSTGYKEAEYIDTLKKSKYGIWLGRHESQGFALEEALACDVPLLVWNAQTMNQENGSNYQPIPCTSIPYWDSRCGEYFHSAAELPTTFQTFQSKLKITNTYQPRQYILENLSLKKCAERFMELIKF
jgi:hypothetical protein